MNTPLDFSADQALFDNLEAVTFTSAKGAGNVTVEVADATFKYVSLKEAAESNGAYRAGDVSFSIRQSLLADAGGAKPGDTVLRASDGVTYTVLTATPTVVTRVWDLACRSADISADLQQLGTLSRPSNAQDGAGRPTLASYTTIAANVPCRVQPEGGRAGDALGRRTVPNRFTAYLAPQVDARAKDTFVCDGVTYTVLDAKTPERLGALMSLALEKVE